MENNKPFEIILDSQYEESYYLYSVIRNLFSYPPIFNEDYNDIDGILYATAFASICKKLVDKNNDIYVETDYQLLIDQLDLVEENKYIYKVALKNDINVLDESFKSIVQETIQLYESSIRKDIESIFTTDQMQYNLFDSIYHMDKECSYDNSNTTYIGDGIFD